jgi:glucose-6-phosphate 1-epimerase
MPLSSSNPFGELAGVERTATHGLPSVRVQTGEASGLIFLQGAQLAEWVPAGQSPIIWLSEKAIYQPGKAVRGGVPICFPWFGENAEHQQYPAHGFARTTEFKYLGARLDDSGRVELELSLEDDDATYRLFPHPFEARLRVALGRTLELGFTVSNRGSDPFSFEEALHSYFHVADVREASVVGLHGATYHDKVRGMAEFSENAVELRLTGETDRVYDSVAACTIVDTVGKRSLRVEKSSSQNTVLWNPWSERAAGLADFGANAWPRMLCVESANVGGSRISLAPGESHTLRVVISQLGIG